MTHKRNTVAKRRKRPVQRPPGPAHHPLKVGVVTDYLGLKMPRDERDALFAAAAARGLNQSEYARIAIRTLIKHDKARAKRDGRA